LFFCEGSDASDSKFFEMYRKTTADGEEESEDMEVE
jgi:hypothetical protein